MIKATMISLIVGSTATVGIVGTAIPVSIMTNNSQKTSVEIKPIQSLKKWTILENQAIATKSLNIEDMTNAAIEFLFTRQNEYIKKIDPFYNVAKAVKSTQQNNGSKNISFKFFVPQKNEAELNAITQTFFMTSNNWIDLHNFCASKIQEISLSTQIQSVEIVYSLVKNAQNDNLLDLSPSHLLVSANNKEYKILLTEEAKSSSYSLFLVENLTVNIGTVFNKGQGIFKPLVVKQQIFDGDLLTGFDQKNNSIVDLAQNINSSFIFNNRMNFFENWNDLSNESFIDSISTNVTLEKALINVEVSYKGGPSFKNQFKIKVNDDNLLTFSHLSDIYNWGQNASKTVIQAGTPISDDLVIDSVVKTINNLAKSKFPDMYHVDNFVKKIGGPKNSFSMEINPGSFFYIHDEILAQICKIFGWNGKVWETTVTEMGTFPNASQIQNIIVEFDTEITSKGRDISVKVLPAQVRITFNGLNLSDIIWKFSNKLQNDKSYWLYFENTNDNYKIQDTFLDNLVSWPTPPGKAISVDVNKQSIGEITNFFTDYVYSQQLDKFGYLPVDTKPQSIDENNRSNNRFCERVVGKIISQDMFTSKFRRIWKMEWPQWQNKVKSTPSASRWVSNVNGIGDMQVFYDIEFVKKDSEDILRYRIKPVSVSILYGYGPSTSWNFSGELQEKLSYDVLFKVIYFTNSTTKNGTLVNI